MLGFIVKLKLYKSIKSILKKTQAILSMIKYIVMYIFVTDLVIDNGTLTTVDYITEFTIVRVQFLNFTIVNHYM